MGQGLVFSRMMAMGLGAVLLVSPLAYRPAYAGSGKAALGAVAGAALGAAMLGVLNQAQTPHPSAAPPAGAPKKPKSAAKSSASNKVAPAAPKSDLTNSNVDPFAAGGSSVPVVDKP